MDCYGQARHMPLALRRVNQKWVIRGSTLLKHNMLLCNTPEKGALQCDLMIATEHWDQAPGLYLCVCKDTQLPHKQNTHTHIYTSRHINVHKRCWSFYGSSRLSSLIFYFILHFPPPDPLFFFFPLSFFNPVIPVIVLCDRKLQRIN